MKSARSCRKQKEAGADCDQNLRVGQSMRQGGAMTLSQEQLNAACDEAKKQGLRTLVHAYKDAVRAATLGRLHADRARHARDRRRFEIDGCKEALISIRKPGW